MNVDIDNALTGAVIGAAITVHRELGPGLEEAAYEEALSIRLNVLGVGHECQRVCPISYKGADLEAGYRLDVLVVGRLPIELKVVQSILPIHEAQLLTYMRLGRWPLGLLINFEVASLKEGVRRKVLTNPRVATAAVEPELRDGFDSLSAQLLHAAAEIHRTLGPGLLRSSYEECLCHELELRSIPYERRYRIPLRFEDRDLAHYGEVPLVVGGVLPVYCMSVALLTKLHEGRLLSRMRQAGWKHGFLLNFNVPTISYGIRRLTRG